MGKKKIIVLAGGIALLAGGAAVVAAVGLGGGSGKHQVDTARVRADIAAKLPAGWSDTVTAHGDTVTVNLVHKGGLVQLIEAMRADSVVNGDRPEMMRLVPRGNRADEVYLFQYFAGDIKEVQAKVAAGKGHHSAHPDLQFMTKEFINAQMKMAPAEDAAAH